MPAVKKPRQDNYLCYIPRKKHQQWQVNEGKVILLFDHNKPAEKFARWLVKKPYTSDMELDEAGSKVWSYIDGESTVFDISKKIRMDFGDEFDPDYRRLIAYLNYLNKKGWISFLRGPQEQRG